MIIAKIEQNGTFVVFYGGLEVQAHKAIDVPTAEAYLKQRGFEVVDRGAQVTMTKAQA
jgi:hypothetical protein